MIFANFPSSSFCSSGGRSSSPAALTFTLLYPRLPLKPSVRLDSLFAKLLRLDAEGVCWQAARLWGPVTDLCVVGKEEEMFFACRWQGAERTKEALARVCTTASLHTRRHDQDDTACVEVNAMIKGIHRASFSPPRQCSLRPRLVHEPTASSSPSATIWTSTSWRFVTISCVLQLFIS